MRLSRLYFCYGSILTSVLWLSVILIYFSIQETQVPPLHQDHAVVRSENDAPESHRMMSQSEQLTLSLPNLDELAIVHNPQEKLLRADGNFC